MITYKPLPIMDKEINSCIKETSSIWKLSDVDKFKKQYKNWILSSENFKITGLDDFKKLCVVDGVTGAFGNFMNAYDGELVTFRGEYPFHRDTGASVLDFVNQLRPGHKLIISHPFSASGNKHPNLDRILGICDSLDIPVFLDMAYFGLAKLPDFDVSRKCIKMVAFSLSKTFGTGKCKIGICFHNVDKKLHMDLLNEYNYVNHISINMHSILLDKFSPDYLYCKYHVKQKLIAETLNVDPSGCVHLLTTDDEKWKRLGRDKFINRLGIGPLLIDEELNKEKVLGAEVEYKPN